jgi:hypothetical protein
MPLTTQPPELTCWQMPSAGHVYPAGHPPLSGPQVWGNPHEESMPQFLPKQAVQPAPQSFGQLVASSQTVSQIPLKSQRRGQSCGQIKGFSLGSHTPEGQ